MPFTHGLLKRIMQLLRGNFPLVEIRCHQIIIQLYGLIDDCSMSILNRGYVRLSLSPKKTIDHVTAV